VADSTIPDGDASVDPNLGIPLGATIQLWTTFGVGKLAIGTHGTYLVTDASQTDRSIHILGATAATGSVVIVRLGQLSDGAGYSPATGNPGSQGQAGGGMANPTAPLGASNSTPPVPDPANLTGANASTPTAPFTFPVAGYTLRTSSITQPFGPVSPSSVFYGIEPAYAGYPSFHEGIDLAVPNSAPSPNIVAAISGTVLWVHHVVGTGAQADEYVDTRATDGQYHGPTTVYFGGYGYNVVIRAGDIITLYGPMVDGSAPAAIQQYSPVTAGATVGVMNNTGASTGRHLHFGVYDCLAGAWVDPRPYLPNG
jgi:murein DD-endopeptidase MepM/ murein hydrolase activator NlpD